MRNAEKDATEMFAKRELMLETGFRIRNMILKEHITEKGKAWAGLCRRR